MNEQDEIQNLPQVVRNSAGRFGSRLALAGVNGPFYSYSELDRAVRALAQMLMEAGTRKGDRVALLAENSPHWGIAYFGILASGGVTVPILPDFTGKDAAAILAHASVKLLFVSGKLLSKIKKDLPGTVERVILLDELSFRENADLQEEEIPAKPAPPLIDPGDLAAIIYTSGTTGNPKGVMLTHENILSNAKQARTIHEVVPDDRFLSILPLAHTYECTIGLVVPLLNGASIHYTDRAPTASYLKPILQRVKPTTMLTVPLIIEKIYRTKVRPSLMRSPLTRSLMKSGIIRGILSRLAVRKLLRFFGGELRFFGIGGAPLAPDVEQFLVEGRFPYAIGYGLTETAPLLAGFNPSRAIRRSVGSVLKGVELRIDQPDPDTGEGEIVARGPNIMKGYYRDEMKTKEVFTPDGYFRTGDLGYLDDSGLLYIRGRLKNMILGANGENIYPEEIEALLNSREIVTESLVLQHKGRLVARVHLNLEVLEEQYRHLKESAAEFQHHFQASAQEILDELKVHVNQQLAKNTRLQMLILQIQPFEKTPTQKIKRFLYV